MGREGFLYAGLFLVCSQGADASIDGKNKLFATSVTQMIRHLVVNVFTFDSTPTVIPALPSYHLRCVRVCLDEAELGALNLNQGKHVGDFENCEREVRSI